MVQFCRYSAILTPAKVVSVTALRYCSIDYTDDAYCVVLSVVHLLVFDALADKVKC